MNDFASAFNPFQTPIQNFCPGKKPRFSSGAQRMKCGSTKFHNHLLKNFCNASLAGTGAPTCCAQPPKIRSCAYRVYIALFDDVFF